MSDPQAQLEGLKAGWDLCRAQDDQKQSLITGLFAYIDDLSKKLSEAESELSDKKDVIKLTRDRVKNNERQIEALQLEKDRHVFATVLIDGECMPFRDELVKQGMDGGKRTASLLKQAVEEELQSSAPSAHHIQVIVRVYANVKGLAETYKEMEILPEPASLNEFIHGFNMGDAMCDYVDAGNGKEFSDEKIRANFRHDFADVHCQRILFSGTAGNGYARLLGPFIEDETACRRITLLKGPHFAHELADIKDRFRTVSFDNVFRSQKLVIIKRKVSFHLTPPGTPLTDYAMAAATAPSTLIPASATQKDSTVSKGVVVTEILKNRKNQRVDSRLSYFEPDFFKLKKSKLCNSFHLLGRCPHLENNGICLHQHGERLNSKQMQALRAVARQSPCQSGLYCRDPDCLCGHRCTKANCLSTNCWFPQDMHNVDINVVKVG